MSQPQIDALTNLVNGDDIESGVYGLSAHGGFYWTIQALLTRGLIDRVPDHWGYYNITPAGRAALDEARPRD